MKNIKVAKYWDNSSDKWFENADYYLEQVIKNPATAFPVRVYSFIKRQFPNLKDIKVCVPSSGDSFAAFAFHLLGASVCSSDISEKQIINAKRMADKKKWDIEFIRDDSMSLKKIESNRFDLVYTSNGVHVWISDLDQMYNSFNRILKDSGSLIFFETHPMLRPFQFDEKSVKVVRDYLNTELSPDSGVNRYAWCIQDFINSLKSAGFEIKEMSEFHSSPTDFIKHDYIYTSEEERNKDNNRLYNWKENPWAALPQCLGIWAKKQAKQI